jgi:GntR family transcriptional regulator
MSTSVEQFGARISLTRRISDDIRRRILDKEWQPGEKIHSESELATTYKVSRVTVRTALKSLEYQGLVNIRHGSGTYVNNFGRSIPTGLNELRSMSETISELGYTPGMEYRESVIRPATAQEMEKLQLDTPESVLYLERAVLADKTAVAFSYDTINIGSIPPEVVEEMKTGSVFASLDSIGSRPLRALAEVHAIVDSQIGWGDKRPANNLFLLLQQIHYAGDGEPIMFSRSYFMEGRFQFLILRTR